ncbi:hypothetical protein Bpfe_025147 [Biomphalaria pfeifferi]|uniref:Uncharacterized protein n=1 Tax=Biomphalaria pfeifferi TaxID=112525 RepID=A0AAD8AZX4_BIOPF|nr:hypothetical protein Bpfe_025147 [Biomphalaria pfeifferi]
MAGGANDIFSGLDDVMVGGARDVMILQVNVMAGGANDIFSGPDDIMVGGARDVMEQMVQWPVIVQDFSWQLFILKSKPANKDKNMVLRISL